MTGIDVERLLKEVSAETPSGPDLEYDAVFGEMERAAQGKAEQQYGDTVVEAEPPDWREVKNKALDVLARSKDLRAAVYLAKAALSEDGLSGFRDVLAVLHGYVEKYWSSLHPQLDPDDDNDPTIRVNTLMALCDLPTTITFLRNAPLVSVRTIGQFTRRDLALAAWEIEPSHGETAPDMAVIDGAFRECDFDQLRITATAASECLASAKAIESQVAEFVGASNGPNFEVLLRELKAIDRVLAEKFSTRAPYEDAAAPETAAPQSPSAGAPRSEAPKGAVPANAAVVQLGEIASREDALRALDKIIQYFERNEPSSPLPLLLNRAKRLSKKSFLEILRDISPNGVSQAEAVGGLDGIQSSGNNHSSAAGSYQPSPQASGSTSHADDDY